MFLFTVFDKVVLNTIHQRKLSGHLFFYVHLQGDTRFGYKAYLIKCPHKLSIYLFLMNCFLPSNCSQTPKTSTQHFVERAAHYSVRFLFVKPFFKLFLI